MGIQTEQGFREWRHVHAPHWNGGGTALFEVNLKERTVTVAWSTVSKRDQFCREIGRKITEGRLTKGECVTYPYVQGTPLLEGFIQKIIEGNVVFRNGHQESEAGRFVNTASLIRAISDSKDAGEDGC